VKTYIGYRVDGSCAVEVHCEPLVSRGRPSRSVCMGDVAESEIIYFLRSRLDLRYESPGFCWGRPGARALQLAVALLADAIGEDHALECYEDFCGDVVVKLRDRWELTDDDILGWYRGWKTRAQEASPEELVGA